MECRSIDAYLNQPLSPSEEKENNLLKTLQGSHISRDVLLLIFMHDYFSSLLSHVT